MPLSVIESSAMLVDRGQSSCKFLQDGSDTFELSGGSFEVGKTPLGFLRALGDIFGIRTILPRDRRDGFDALSESFERFVLFRG